MAQTCTVREDGCLASLFLLIQHHRHNHFKQNQQQYHLIPYIRGEHAYKYCKCICPDLCYMYIANACALDNMLINMGVFTSEEYYKRMTRTHRIYSKDSQSLSKRNWCWRMASGLWAEQITANEWLSWKTTGGIEVCLLPRLDAKPEKYNHSRWK